MTTVTVPAAGATPRVVPPELLQRLDAQMIVALTLWAEARNQPLSGMRAVLCVMRNRLRRRLPHRWGLTWAEVCLKPAQFSCWTDPGPNGRRLAALARRVAAGERVVERVWPVCLEQAGLYVADPDALLMPDVTKGADHYLTQALYDSPQCPAWARTMEVAGRFGDHVFLREFRRRA